MHDNKHQRFVAQWGYCLRGGTRKKFDLKNVVVFIAMFPLIVVRFSIFEKAILL